MATPFRPPVPKPISKRQQTNTAGVTSKDRNTLGPRPDGGGGGELPPDTSGVVPVGGIIMFSGAFADIPDNWHLCDGNDGTPDLTDRFILGTVTEGDVGATGGTYQHKHAPGDLALVAASAGTPAGTVNSAGSGTDAHTTTAVQSGAGTTVVTGPATHTVDGHTHGFTGAPLATHTHTFDPAEKTAVNEDLAGSTDQEDVLPPFYRLAFIQRIA